MGATSRRALLGGHVLGQCPQLDVSARAGGLRRRTRSTGQDLGAQRVCPAYRVLDAVEGSEALVVVQRPAQHVAVAGDDGQRAAKLMREGGELLVRHRTRRATRSGMSVTLRLGALVVGHTGGLRRLTSRAQLTRAWSRPIIATATSAVPITPTQ